MLDIRLIRRDPDAVRAALARRGESDVSVLDQVLALTGGSTYAANLLDGKMLRAGSVKSAKLGQPEVGLDRVYERRQRGQ